MDEVFLTIFFISLLLFLLGSGVWVALSMIAVSAIGMMLFTTRPVGDAYLFGWEKFYLGQNSQKIYLKVCLHGYQNYLED
jgi:hypothetical protein